MDKNKEEEMLNDIDVLIKKKVELENENENLKAQLTGCRNYIEQVHKEFEKKDKDIEWLKTDADEMRWNVRNLIALYDRAESEHRNDKIEFAITHLSILKLRFRELGVVDFIYREIDDEIYRLKKLREVEKDGKD